MPTPNIPPEVLRDGSGDLRYKASRRKRLEPRTTDGYYVPRALVSIGGDEYGIILDGVNEVVSMGNVAPLQFERTDPFSVSIWFKTMGTGVHQVYAKREQQAPYRYRGYGLVFRGSVTPNEFRIDLASNDSTLTGIEILVYSTPGTWNDGTWHHAVFTYSGNSLASGVNLYLDGTVQTKDVITDTLTDTMQIGLPFLLGARGDPAGVIHKFWYGNLDEASVWGIELTSDQVAEIYNGGATPGDLSALHFAGHIVSWWRLGDQDTFPTLRDVYGTNDGTMINMESGDIVADVP